MLSFFHYTVLSLKGQRLHWRVRGCSGSVAVAGLTSNGASCTLCADPANTKVLSSKSTTGTIGFGLLSYKLFPARSEDVAPRSSGFIQSRRGHTWTSLDDHDDESLKSQLALVNCKKQTGNFHEGDNEMGRLLETLSAAAAAAGQSFVDQGHPNDNPEELFEAELLIHAKRLFPGGDGWELRNDESTQQRQEPGEHILSLRRIVRSALETARQRSTVAQGTAFSESRGTAIRSSSQPKKIKSSGVGAETSVWPAPIAIATTSATAFASFSLLDQLDSSRWLLANLVSPEEVRGAESAQDKLVLMQQIHVLDPDELLADKDWQEVYVATIRRALTSTTTTATAAAAAATSSSPDSNDDPPQIHDDQQNHLPLEVFAGYVELVHKWIHMTDPSTCGGGMSAFHLQVDLIRAVSDALAFRAARLTKEEDKRRASYGTTEVAAASTPTADTGEWDVVTTLFRCWWMTWMNWMLTYDSWGAGDDRIHAIGLAMWDVITSHPAMEEKIVAMDPLARWFSSWMAVLCHPREILGTLCGGDPKAGWDGGEHYEGTGAASPAGIQLSCAWHRHLLPVADQPIRNEILPACCYWLSIIRSLLVHLRVSRFPWSLFVADQAGPATDGADGDHRSILCLSGLYLRFLSFLRLLEGSSDNAASYESPSKEDPGTLNRLASMQEMCLDALDTLLSGCRDQSLRRSTLVELRIRVEAESSQSAMQGLERHLHQFPHLHMEQSDANVTIFPSN